MMFRLAAPLGLLLALGQATALAADAPAPAPAPLKTVERDRIIIAGQPGALDLEQLRQQGVVGVFNLRTDTEMADRAQVPYDEATLAQELGYDYVQEPVGGTDHPFRPEVLAAFKAQLDRSEGKILLHCATGGRAGLLYAAYAVKYLGQQPDEAMRSLESLGGWPLPLERLTGIPLKVERREAEAAPR
ncbi:MAG TPA: sulfur transferase domain-containing protein [Pseudomonadota bacterium]|nr:sulfur transferase domain-containing protein [Pseudomonadota bacterium]HRA36464.1 sulfur transferase domain-containing protein [Pseudomonadota bacterium]